MGISNYQDNKDPNHPWKDLFLAQFNHGYGGICIYSLENGTIIDSNDRFLDMVRYSRQDLIGASINRLLVWADVRTGENYQKDLSEKEKLQNLRCMLHQKCGKDLPVVASAVKISAGEHSIICFLCLEAPDLEPRPGSDEIDRKTKELELIAQVSSSMRTAQNRPEIYSVLAKQFAALLGAQGVAIVIKDIETGQFIVELGYLGWENWTGIRTGPSDPFLNQVVFKNQPSLWNNYSSSLSVERKCFFGHLDHLASIPLIANQQIIGVILIGRNTPISDDDLHVLISIGDMVANAIQREKLRDDLKTQLENLHQAQARLVQTEKMAAIGELVAGVAHELNNPLTTILLFSQVIQQKIDSEDIRHDLDRIIFAARQANSIVRSLLDFSRQRNIERLPVEINEVLKSCLDVLAHELVSNSITCELHLDQTLPITQADPHQLHQVFVNLIQNAIQAMAAVQESGILNIYTESGFPFYPDEGPISQPIIRISFQDNGPGMSADVLKRIFDPFFTTKPVGSGTGLGLAVCHGIVTEHKGHIWAESLEGIGTTFYIELPIIKTEEPAQETKATPLPVVLPGQVKILVIEDEVTVSEVIRKALERRGFQVDTTLTCRDGLAAFSKSPYNLLISDIHLPDMNGPELYEKILLQQPKMANRIIFMSGDTITRSNWRFIEQAGVPILNKPFSLEDLYEKIDHIVSIKK